MTHNKKEKKTVSIRSRLIFAFIAFTVIVLVLLWLCETVFMGDIYRALKLRAVDRCADSAAEYVVDGFDTVGLDEKMSDLSRRYGMCISVYGITDSGRYKTGKLLVDKHANTMCFIHNLRNLRDMESDFPLYCPCIPHENTRIPKVTAITEV